MAKRRSGGPRQVHQYDKILRENLEATLPGIIRNVLGIHVAQAEELPDDLQHTKERHPDVLKKVMDQTGETFVLHIEFQVKDEPKMIWRMAEYFVMLSRLYEMEVRQYVIYIGPGTPTMASRLQCKQMQFYYQLVTLSEIDYKVLLYANDPCLKMLAILADLKGETPINVIEHIITDIIHSADGELEWGKQINQLSILSQLRNLEIEIDNVMDSIAPFFSLERDPFYKRGLEKGKKIFIKNLLRKTRFSIARIAELAEVSEDFVLEIKKSLR